MQDAIQSILNLPMEDQVSQHVVSPGVAKAQALANIIQYRETTNQQLLRLYEKMYEDLRGEKIDTKYEYYHRIVATIAENTVPNDMVAGLDFVNQFFGLEK